jgi:hypothetical protein
MPQAPSGKKWIEPSNSRACASVAVLVDDNVSEISHMLLQIEPKPGAVAAA